MRIALYGGGLHREGSGIQVYVRNLLEAMRRSYPDEELTLVYNVSRCAFRHSDYCAAGAKIRTRQFYVPEEHALRLWNKIGFPHIDGCGSRYDIVHSATSYMPPVRYAKKVVTVHDLACLTHPNQLIISGLRAKYTVDSIQNADLVIADSEHTRQDVIRLLGISEDKVVTVYLGIDPQYLRPRSELDDRAVIAKYGIDYPYILFIGNIDPRKNIRGLVTAYARYAKGYRTAPRLLLVGKKTSRAESELAVIDEMGVKDRVAYLGYVPRGDLPAIYTHAQVFIFPSFFEGFGFPVLEAMSCGVPVIVSDTSSLPEIAGDAAYYVTPESVTGIVKALGEVMADERLRNSMIRKGLEQAGKFRWERTAQKTMDCYRTLGNGG